MRRDLGAGLAPWQLARARQMLLSERSADHSNAALAAACGLSRGYFCKAFKASTGLPPHRWLLHHRVDCACEMLAHSALGISDIALACGFADQSHLTRIFHAMTGSSPADWRRQARSGMLADGDPTPDH